MVENNKAKDSSGYGRRNYLKYGLAGLTAGLAGCVGDNGGNGDDGGNGDNGEPETVRWTAGTPGEGSSTFAIANGMSRILDEQGSSINLEVASYSGSNEAIRLVGRGDDELAGAALPLASAAYNSSEPVPDGPADFTGDNALDIKPVQSLNFLDFTMYWVTLEDNDIDTVSDLEGKNVGVFEQGAAFNNLTILSVLGMLDDVNTRYVPFNSIASALDEGRIDATGIYASQGRTPAGWQTQIINNENVQMVTYSDDQIDQIGSSGYATPAPVYVDDIYSKDLPMDTITGMAIPYGFFTRPEISQDRMYEFTSTLLNNVDQVQQFAESVSHFDAEYAAQSLSPGIPVHSGVAQYLKENDLWRDELSEA